MVRAALTPSPSPALRERGELVHGLGAAQNRSCSAHLPPSSPTAWERKGGQGDGAGSPHPQPLSRAAGEGRIWSKSTAL